MDEDRRLAAELRAKATCELKDDLRNGLLTLAAAYVRLAEMGERNRISGPIQGLKDK